MQSSSVSCQTRFSAEEAQRRVAMDKQSAVVFRNVGQLYFPQTRVECHYSLSSEHQWSSGDWIGIFQVGWTAVKQYYTYTWALVPEGYTEGSSVNCCAVFQAFYLPRPSNLEYQFVYLDKAGQVCARSRSFTFCAPKPLDELETLREEQDEEDGEEELLLVVPRAQLLQSRLEESLKKQADLQRALDEVRKETQDELKNSTEERMEWECERDAMREEISELRDELRRTCETMRKMEGKHKDVKYSQESLTCELSKLMAEKAESQQQIKGLEEDIKILNDREKEENLELERLKERVRKMSSQMKHDEDKRKSLQAENEAALAEIRGLQERLEASEHVAESLRRELREMGVRQGHAHTELHQARLQVAQLTLHLSEENLLLREERANWALEREAYKHAAETEKKKIQELSSEVQKKEEWLQEERTERERLEAELALLSDAKRELQELKAGLRKDQKEREEQQVEKQELLDYVRQLEQKLGTGTEGSSDGDTPTRISPGSSSEDDDHLDQPSTAETPPETPVQSEDDAPAPDAQDERGQHCESRAAERKQLFLPVLVDPILSVLADSPMW